MSILVCGGAGYIGAHVVRLLQQRGEKVVVVDDLSTGSKDRIGDAMLVELDVASDEAITVLTNTMVDQDVTAVIHFAARKQVGESVERPMWYYRQNIGGLANVLSAMQDAGVDQMIFSSSAAVYGMPPVEVVAEDVECHPINPYGETKLIGEWMMADCERAWGLKWIGLRYFNVAGAGWPDLADGAIMNLIPMLLDRIERGESAKIFGDDYDTPDGTCIRDYIHVLDLAEAHIAGLDVLAQGRQPDHHTYNVGTGLGTSVKEIVDGLRKAIGWDFPVEVLGRRAGDPPKLIGDTLSIGVDLGWKANNGVDEIIESAWEGWQAGPRKITVPGQ
ncbi:UDP-glucose 4-epimerase GalE [Schaalia vaccimaxillae]|uniref:UDP-glucose 4-epimerase GalE n=1 Tax=Schaalia vaccimaxillae TaxID=183916 RepID=UPI0003B5DAC9|nr:UDP-glucose 4-epimerase GalE [Schaalia vaccimaxillae]